MNPHYKLINRTYEDVSDAIQVLENKRDYNKEFSDHEKNLLAELYKIWESCRNTGLIPSSYVDVIGTELDFSFVTADWIRDMIDKTGVDKVDFGKNVNVKPTQVSQWLSGYRNPSGSAQAAIYYYFEKLKR